VQFGFLACVVFGRKSAISKACSCKDLQLTPAFEMQAKQRTKQHGKTLNGVDPKSLRRNGIFLDTNVQTNELSLAVRAAGLDTSTRNFPAAKKQKQSNNRPQNVSRPSRPSYAGSEHVSDEPVCVACSGVQEDVLERCRRAVERLGNATMVNTEEEAMKGKLTHLVLGTNKRSGKLLLALANDAVVVRPAWLVQCIRWRRWLPADDFVTEVRLTQ
jgi:hypothetical protein